MISFPLGGVAAGSIGLGGRGQLRDWEIFNRPNKGFSPTYAFPAIWVQSGNSQPVAHVLESRITPPYEGQDGLGSNNAPGLSRLEGAVFTGEYPVAHIDFQDSTLPVTVSLDAFSPFIPHEPDESGLPVAVLRYRVTNHRSTAATVGICFSLDNPVNVQSKGGSSKEKDSRRNQYKVEGALSGIVLDNPGLSVDDPMFGSIALAAVSNGARTSHWEGWPRGRWWNSPLLFWDAFSAAGELGAAPAEQGLVAALCQQRTIQPGESGDFTFLLSWHFANRTPDWCGWAAPEGKGDAKIGNFYATRFRDAWEAAKYAAANLEALEERTRLFARALRETTLPGVVKEAASANLSTLASTTCFRTADGAFHGFEGSNDASGCCFGNCTHVWNYETSTTFLFPSFARSLREAAFGYSMDDEGGMRFRQLLPDGIARFDTAAADGQMGQIVHAYLDWKVSGDDAWARGMWPRIQKAIAFAWRPGGWDSEKRGVLTGVQHNTYDVEFYGPNPMCGSWYLAALRACEEMARAFGDPQAAQHYRQLFEQGSKWMDGNLFNGDYFVQQMVGRSPDQIAPHLRAGMGSDDPEHPEYQVGNGCLIDQLVGQYLANVAGLGPLVSSDHIRSSLQSLLRFNYKRTLVNHNNVERTFALNDEAALVICDYADSPRPRIPFPYFEEVMTGFEHSAAALMIYSGLVPEGVECIGNIRARYDGIKRNPWDEAECGHHYARAMAAWSSVVGLSGFSYDGIGKAVTAVPRVPHRKFHCVWASGTGWGTFTYQPSVSGGTRFSMNVLHGELSFRSCEISLSAAAAMVSSGGKQIEHTLQASGGRTVIHFARLIHLERGNSMVVETHA
ncbi:MAG TPA: GH116 family glycosyl-hydrolase [Terracidiphilus sp.]|nr:GH116 family glycosyl-hydrolase [Terracidiphilus sp.]